MTTSIYDLLIAATARLTAENGSSEGTGFFVSPSRLLTCAHVVRAKDGSPLVMRLHYRGKEHCVLNMELSQTDLCLLTVPSFDHSCVVLSDVVQPRDQLFFFGFPGTAARNVSRGESAAAASDGVVVETIDDVTATYLKFVPGGVKPGMSGAPLLNERTGAVCAVVKRTRNREIDQGGLAISVKHALSSFADLREGNRSYEQSQAVWTQARQIAGLHLIPGCPTETGAGAFTALVTSRAADFVGREFVFNALDKAISDESRKSGYILITGEPGVGKTALMAQLVKTRGYAHHFNGSGLKAYNTRQFVEGIAAQLALKYGFVPQSPPDDPGGYGQYLNGLFADSARSEPKKPVVVLVDAIDEASDEGLASNSNRLSLPRDLPDHVFVVLTSRPKRDFHLVVDSLVSIPISADSVANQKDARRYITGFIERFAQQMTSSLIEWGVGEDEFVRTLEKHSEGNFMYLKHVLPAVRDGSLNKDTIGDVHKLPQGLLEFYQWHWRQTRECDPQNFENVTKPVICAFATAKEPVSASQIVHWTRARWPALTVSQILDVVANWRPFLDEDHPTGSPPLYRIYHASFRDFLDDVVGLGLYHDMIIDAALSRLPSVRPKSDL